MLGQLPAPLVGLLPGIVVPGVLLLPDRPRWHREHGAAAFAHEGSRGDIRLTLAGLGQSQWHVDAHRLDVIDGGEQCGQAVRDIRGDERAVV